MGKGDGIWRRTGRSRLVAGRSGWVRLEVEEACDCLDPPEAGQGAYKWRKQTRWRRAERGEIVEVVEALPLATRR